MDGGPRSARWLVGDNRHLTTTTPFTGPVRVASGAGRAIVQMSTDPLPEIEPPRSTPAEERERGRQARSRISLGEQGRGPTRGSIDPMAILGEQAKMRVAEWSRSGTRGMLGSAFGFYRGGAAVMAADLASTSGHRSMGTTLRRTLTYPISGSTRRRSGVLIFDINDFDETAPGPFEWDVKRLATSFEIATAGPLGFEPADRREDRGRRRPRVPPCQMLRFADMRHLDVWYARLDAAGAMESGSPATSPSGPMSRRCATGCTSRWSTTISPPFPSSSKTTNGRTRFISQPPLLVPIEELSPTDRGGCATQSADPQLPP